MCLQQVMPQFYPISDSTYFPVKNRVAVFNHFLLFQVIFLELDKN